eukprot:CAMPEP_0167753792 /NCGR_PEP_ID=MMETSP0110_2-20121227/7909_1 /TAXON_ID=629695 /ORGANISM="Gymnochlora sp., Strain CCMP2014" /LENGTH=445 /DNA_ID=CAMNT_0007639595 /DNA_START=303 /DNA_END=1640 /DNA_ORIENTATION=-
MVYDEGLHFTTKDGKNAFAFFEYQPKKNAVGNDVSAFISNCHKTRIGWYHTKDNLGRTMYGCFKAEKISDSGSLAATSSKALLPRSQMILSPTSFVNVRPKLADPAEKFAFNLSFIEEVNADPASTWTAHPHAFMENISKRQAYRMIGASKYFKPSHGWDRRTYFQRQSSLYKTPQMVSFLESSAVRGLPENFDWRNYIEDFDPIDQGACGSCYSVSSTMMASIRRQIARAKKDGTLSLFESGMKHGSMSKLSLQETEDLSSQDVLNCSPQNQGCEGGYPFLVGMHSYTMGIAMKSKEPYIGMDVADHCRADERAKSTGYGYIGGHYGGGCPEALMLDIYKYGPAAVGIDTPTSLFSYSGGIFQCSQTRHEGTNLKNLKSWEATNHAVLVYGWGETKTGQKYWILKNSWGAYWGENGFFKLARASKGQNADACAITSMPVGVYFD